MNIGYKITLADLMTARRARAAAEKRQGELFPLATLRERHCTEIVLFEYLHSHETESSFHLRFVKGMGSEYIGERRVRIEGRYQMSNGMLTDAEGRLCRLTSTADGRLLLTKENTQTICLLPDREVPQ